MPSPSTQRRSGRPPEEGASFPSDVVADNTRSYRVLARLSQDDLAQRMRALNLSKTWSQNSVSEVERYIRTVNIDELFSLALVLEVSVSDLLDPHGPDGRRDLNVDLAGPGIVDHEVAHAWMRDQITLRLEWTGDGYKTGRLTMVPREGNDDLVLQLSRKVARQELQQRNEEGPQ